MNSYEIHKSIPIVLYRRKILNSTTTMENSPEIKFINHHDDDTTNKIEEKTESVTIIIIFISYTQII